MTEEELVKEIERRFGDEDFDYEVDAKEWTDPQYHHQN